MRWTAYSICVFICLLSSIANSAPATLRCDVGKRCDAFAENCVIDPLVLVATVDPRKGQVTVGGRTIKADFTKNGEVIFTWTKFRVTLNKLEWSAVMASTDEVRSGWCSLAQPAW